MARKAKILAILLVFCLLAAVYAPAVSAASDNHPFGPPRGGTSMWRWIWGGEAPPLPTPTVAADDNKVDAGKNVTKVTPDCPKPKRGK